MCATISMINQDVPIRFSDLFSVKGDLGVVQGQLEGGPTSKLL